MTQWIRVRHDGDIKFGVLADEQIDVFAGDMFDHPEATSERIPLASVEVLPPCLPTKIIGLWNNLRAAAAQQGRTKPEEPLYFFKPPSCVLGPGGTIVKPRSYEGRVLFEGELGVVIGRRCTHVSETEAADCVLGYTCVNDVTAVQLIHDDPSFAQWGRSKGLDTFGPFGPVIATDLDPQSLRVAALVDGVVRQDYPVSDMFYGPLELVERISRDMTLLPGDIIACGTSMGAEAMTPGCTVEVRIDGIGTLSNDFAGAAAPVPS